MTDALTIEPAHRARPGSESDSGSGEVDRAVRAADLAFRTSVRSPATDRTRWLRTVADRLDDAADELIAIATAETGLATPRLVGEVARTTGQLRMFAAVIEEGSYVEAIIDHAATSATPPRPDLRRTLRPIGPVAVFAASNFPFAFSVAGGDTASALAIGAPVIVKAHSGHPLLSLRTAEIVSAALAEAGAPDGLFGLVGAAADGSSRAIGIELVEHPLVAAASFTGSVAGGRALADRAAARPEPIPFFGELGSLNPVVVTAEADAARGEALAAGLAGSFQGSAGQLCTKPGIVFVPRGSVLEAALPPHVGAAPHRLLTEAIDGGFRNGVEHLAAVPGVELVAGGIGSENGPAPVVYAVGLDAFADDRHRDVLTREVFGPTTLLVRYDAQDALLPVLTELEGSLTATIHAAPEGELVLDGLVEVLAARAGRLLFDGWPTGVAVTWSQHHGGPWPATTSQHTSVGGTAVRRFQRPIVYQDAPAAVLPPELQEDNPLRIPRRVDGALRLPSRP
ncbi:aldehyde dehydrogenase (NADP(+)) [Leifsonia sp. McL0607]|uniref:aldehyde dehydrogenase (NADP(+)) n=1 Tax=Leifsonia sp. McL0607 TaxID=3415672 RepID=UPI003CF7F878